MIASGWGRAPVPHADAAHSSDGGDLKLETLPRGGGCLPNELSQSSDLDAHATCLSQIPRVTSNATNYSS